MGQAPLRHEARQPGEQAEVHRHRRRLRPRRRRRPPRRSPSSATTSSCFCFQDSPRRAHSIAAQGGINAAKNYQNDGDSVYRLFYDTVKGGDFRAREANVYRLAEVSVNIIDQCVAQGVPFAREYGGLLGEPLLRRRAGLAHVLRARPDRPAAPARRLPGARAADRPRHGEDVPAPRDARPRRGRRPRARHRHARHGHRRDRVARRPTRSSSPPAATATSSTSRPTRRAATPPRSGARTRRAPRSANPCYTQIHPTCIPVTGDHQSKLTLMSESLRNDGRIWVPKKKGDDARRRTRSPRTSATTTSSASTRASATSRRATSPRAPPRRCATRAAASARRGYGVYLDFADAIKRLGEDVDPRALRQPLRHVRAHHGREPLQGADAHLPGRRTTRWAGSGWTTT